MSDTHFRSCCYTHLAGIPTNQPYRINMDAQQLSQVERLCDTLYIGSPYEEGGVVISRQEAQNRLLALQSSADYIPQCQYILDQSQNQYARLVASNSLTELLTSHW